MNHSRLIIIVLTAVLGTTSYAHAHRDEHLDDIVKTADKAKSFGTLLTAAKAAGLAEALQGKGPFTVLAPTDAAFAKLGKKTIASLLRPENKPKLAAILKYHVVPGRVSAADAVRAGKASPLLAKTKLGFTIRDGRLVVQGANVVKNDIAASNGVIHVIDSVLMPPASALPKIRGRKVIGVYLDTPGRALAAQLGLDRHKTTVISRTTAKGEARKAGLKQYDVVLSFGDENGSDAGLKRAKNKREVGQTMEVVVLRNGKKLTVHVPIGFEARR